MPYYFLCDCQTNTKNIFAKLHETYQTFLKKETNTENMPSSPSKRTKLKIPLGKGQPPPTPPPPTPIKIFSLTTTRVLLGIYVHIFIRNQTVSKK